MPVQNREELDDADISWTAADAAVAGVMDKLLKARAALAAEAPVDSREALSDPAVPAKDIVYLGGRR